MSLSLHNRLEIDFKANIQSTLKRTIITDLKLAQSDLSDLVYKPWNKFQGGFENLLKMLYVVLKLLTPNY